MTRRHRLRGAAEFNAVLRMGRRFEGKRLQLVASPASGPAGRVGYVIGSKLLARAVDRNRLKRMLREAIRVRRPGVNAFDIVVRLRRSCAPAELKAVAGEVVPLLDALGADR